MVGNFQDLGDIERLTAEEGVVKCPRPRAPYKYRQNGHNIEQPVADNRYRFEEINSKNSSVLLKVQNNVVAHLV